MIQILLLTIYLTFTMERPIAPKKVVYAVDCGGNRQIKTSLGVQFLKDGNYSQDVPTVDADYYLEPELMRPHVKYTPDTYLYMTERHSEQSFKYFVPMKKNYQLPITETQYVLVLKFAEFYFKEANRRKFHVALGDQNVIENLDVFEVAGFSTAHDEYIEISFENGDIYYKNKRCRNAITENNEIAIEFVKTDFDNPMIHGIFLFEGTIDETDYFDKEEHRQGWEERYNNKTREERKEKREQKVEERKKYIEERQNIIKIRPGHELEIETKAEEIPAQEKPKQRQLPPLSWELVKLILLTPMGIVMMIGFFTSSFVLCAFTFFDPYGHKKIMAQVQRAQQLTEKRRLLEKQDSSTSSASDRLDEQEQLEQRRTVVQPVSRLQQQEATQKSKVNLKVSPKKQN